MNGFLKIYDVSYLECFKTGYLNDPSRSIVQVNGDFIPAWFYNVTGSQYKIYFETLSIDEVRNGSVGIVSSEYLASYVTAEANSMVYAARQVQTLTGLHRLKIAIDGTDYYSDLFKNVNTAISQGLMSYLETGIIIY